MVFPLASQRDGGGSRREFPGKPSIPLEAIIVQPPDRALVPVLAELTMAINPALAKQPRETLMVWDGSSQIHAEKVLSTIFFSAKMTL